MAGTNTSQTRPPAVSRPLVTAWAAFVTAGAWTIAAVGIGLVAGRPAVASPVVDDDRLGRAFVAGLGRIVDAAGGGEAATLDSDAATAQLAAAEGRRVRLPGAATPCTLGPDRPLYDAVMPAVVVVGSIYKCGKCNDWHLGGMASGWLLSADGLVVTNHHVFGREAGHQFGVMTADGRVFALSAVLAADEAGDAVIARIDTRGRELPFLQLGAPPACGDEVAVISHPAGRFYCLTEGVVSRYHRRRQEREPEQRDPVDDQRPREPLAEPARPAVWMSVTADYALGSSGGPVFNAAGEVVGMVSRTFSSRPGGRRTRPGTPGEQMVFKDCVSLDSLGRLVEAANR
jgi:serine protease Do